MSATAPAEQNDRQFCLDQVLHIDPSFRLTAVYAPKQNAASLLALHGLLAALEKMLCEVTEEAVFRAKLEWWQQQLLGGAGAAGNHPIIRELHRTGCMQRWDAGDLLGLLAGFAQRWDPVAPTDQQRFTRLCEDAGWYPMILEWQLGTEATMGKPDDTMHSMAVVSGLFRLLRESANRIERRHWWLPLTWLAKHGMDRTDLRENTDLVAGQALMAEITQVGLDCDRQWRQALGRPSDQVAPGGDWKRSHRHWLAQLLLIHRRLSRLRWRTLSDYRAELVSSRPSDAWMLWRGMRRLSA